MTANFADEFDWNIDSRILALASQESKQ